MSEEVKLYGVWPSPFSRRVELALKLKGVPFEYIEEDLKNKSPELLKYNPIHKKIPVLVHDGKPVAESLVILEYIDETWPNPPILPSDPCDRAKARFWAKFVDEKIVPTTTGIFKAKDEEEAEQITEEVRQQINFFENELTGKDFFGGNSIGYLDIVVFYLIYVFHSCKEAVGIDMASEEKFPLLCKLINEKLLNMDVVKECLPPRDKLIALIRTLTEEAKAAASK